MKMTKLIPLLVSLIAATAFADEGRTIATSGQACQPAYGQDGLVGYGEPGIGNYSSQDARVFCAQQISTLDYNYQGLVENRYLYVQAHDYNSTRPFSCYPWANDQGYNIWGPTKYTCSQWNGCPDSTASHTGTVWMYWDRPFGTAGRNRSLTYGVSCTIPPGSWVQFLWSAVTQRGSN